MVTCCIALTCTEPEIGVPYRPRADLSYNVDNLYRNYGFIQCHNSPIVITVHFTPIFVRIMLVFLVFVMQESRRSSGEAVVRGINDGTGSKPEHTFAWWTAVQSSCCPVA